MIDIILAGPNDEAVLERVAPDVFDFGLRSDLVREFLLDPRHHLALAVDDGTVVGFASAVHYIHPDKDPELWINEVGVAPSHQKRGLGRRLVAALLELASALSCRTAWVLTERSNGAALALYRSAGGVEPSDETVLVEFELDV